MKTSNVIFMALRSMRKRSGTNIALILLMAFLFFMSQLITVTWMGPRAGKWVAESRMGEKLSQWGNITLASDQDWDENVWDFLQELKYSGTVDRIGSFALMGMQDTGLYELAEIQNSTGVKDNTLLDEVTLYTYMTDNIWLFDSLFIEDRNLLSTYQGEYDILLLLGADYKQIDTGTIYQSSLFEDMQYVVVGHLPDGFCFFSDDIYRDDEVWNTGIANKLDDMVILIYQDKSVLTAQGLFYVEAGITQDKLNELKEYADAYGVRISLTRLDTIYERNNRRALAESMEALPYFLVILVSACVILISYYLVDVIGNRKKYGIYYAIGFERKDIIKIMLAENGMRAVIALTVSCILFFKFFRWVYPKGMVIAEAENVLFAAALGIALLTGAVLIFLSIYIPMGILGKETPNDLIHEADE